MYTPNKKCRNLGFTLVEMLLVMTIIGVLAAVVVVQFGNLGDKGRINATRASIQAIETAIKTFTIMTGKAPKSIDELTSSVGDDEPLLKAGTLNDGWGVPFQFKFSGNKVEIRSAGKDGQIGTDDDITN